MSKFNLDDLEKMTSVDPSCGPDVSIPPIAASVEWYHNLIDRLAEAEKDACQQKLQEHGMPYSKDSNVFGLLLSSSSYADISIWEAYWSWAGRHIVSLSGHSEMSDEMLRKRFLDLLGYAVLGLALLKSPYKRMSEPLC